MAVEHGVKVGRLSPNSLFKGRQQEGQDILDEGVWRTQCEMDLEVELGLCIEKRSWMRWKK